MFSLIALVLMTHLKETPGADLIGEKGTIETTGSILTGRREERRVGSDPLVPGEDSEEERENLNVAVEMINRA